MLVNIYKATQHHNSEDHKTQIFTCENFKFYTCILSCLEKPDEISPVLKQEYNTFMLKNSELNYLI